VRGSTTHLRTTNIYTEVDLEMKSKALARCEVKCPNAAAGWREAEGLMDFLIPEGDDLQLQGGTSRKKSKAEGS
jgi:hypothetical protein